MSKKTSKRKSRNADRRSLRRILNNAGNFFSGLVNTKRLIRSKYGAGVSRSDLIEHSSKTDY